MDTHAIDWEVAPATAPHTKPPNPVRVISLDSATLFVKNELEFTRKVLSVSKVKNPKPTAGIIAIQVGVKPL